MEFSQIKPSKTDGMHDLHEWGRQHTKRCPFQWKRCAGPNTHMHAVVLFLCLHACAWRARMPPTTKAILTLNGIFIFFNCLIDFLENRSRRSPAVDGSTGATDALSMSVALSVAPALSGSCEPTRSMVKAATHASSCYTFCWAPTAGGLNEARGRCPPLIKSSLAQGRTESA